MVIVEKNKQGITIPNPRGNQIKYSPTASKEYVDNKVAEEQQRAELAEYGLTLELGNLQTAVDTETARAEAVENSMSTEISGLQIALDAEVTRAKGKEDWLDENIDLKIDSTEAYGTFVDFSTEQSIQATKTFKSGINMSNTRIRNLREPNNDTDAANKAYVDNVKTDVDNIKDVIPSQASSTNQLADKEFVNSSIATNTANFIGTFNSVGELPTTGVTNNDYAFVVTNNVYSRYKWNETSWLFEYELNNSSFTQEQWETINAGLTSGDTENLRDVVELVSDVVPEDVSSTNKLVSTKFLEDRHVILPLLSLEATQEELEGVYNAISNAPQGSAFFISLPEGRGVMPVAIAIGGTSVFAQYSDGRYSHELKITLDEGEYLFDKTDVEMADFNMAIDAANEAIDDALDEYAGGAIIGAIKNYHDDSKQDTLTAGSGITIQNNVISATGGSDIPVEKGIGENSVQQKTRVGAENKAISENTTAFGSLSSAGTKAYKWTSISIPNRTITIDGNTWGMNYGDRLSIVNKNHYDDCCTILNLTQHTITVDKLPFTNIEPDEGVDARTLFVVSNPNLGNIDLGQCAHAEGGNTMATQMFSHAEGYGTKAIGQYSHAEGRETEAGYAGHAEGQGTKALGTRSHAEGYNTEALGNHSHAEGNGGKTNASNSHIEGFNGKLMDGAGAHIEGYGNVIDIMGSTSVTDTSTDTQSIGAHAEGVANKCCGVGAHVEGRKNEVSAKYAHAEGYNNKASGISSHAEGNRTRAGIEEVPTEDTTATEGVFTHAEGNSTLAKGSASHAEGAATQALGRASHAEGRHTIAENNYAHAEGFDTYAGANPTNTDTARSDTKGLFTHAEGHYTKAVGSASHAEGRGTQTSNLGEHAEGKWNISNQGGTADTNTQHSVGIGTSETNRKNAFEVMQNGDVYVIGLGGYDGTNAGQENVLCLQQLISRLY